MNVKGQAKIHFSDNFKTSWKNFWRLYIWKQLKNVFLSGRGCRWSHQIFIYTNVPHATLCLCYYDDAISHTSVPHRETMYVCLAVLERRWINFIRSELSVCDTTVCVSVAWWKMYHVFRGNVAEINGKFDAPWWSAQWARLFSTIRKFENNGRKIGLVTPIWNFLMNVIIYVGRYDELLSCHLYRWQFIE